MEDSKRDNAKGKDAALQGGETTYVQLSGYGHHAVSLDAETRHWIRMETGRVVLVAFQPNVVASIQNVSKEQIAGLKPIKNVLGGTAEALLDELIGPFEKNARVEIIAFCQEPKRFAIGSSLLIARDLVMRWPELYGAYKRLSGKDQAPEMGLKTKIDVVECSREVETAILIRANRIEKCSSDELPPHVKLVGARAQP